MTRNVFQTEKKSRRTRRDSRKDTGHSSHLDLKKNGTPRLPINEMVYGPRSPKKCCLYLQRAGILFSEERVLSPEDF